VAGIGTQYFEQSRPQAARLRDPGLLESAGELEGIWDSGKLNLCSSALGFSSISRLQEARGSAFPPFRCFVKRE